MPSNEIRLLDLRHAKKNVSYNGKAYYSWGLPVVELSTTYTYQAHPRALVGLAVPVRPPRVLPTCPWPRTL